MSRLRWEDPPERRVRGRGKYKAVADSLRARPGEWARIREGIKPKSGDTQAWLIRRGVGYFAPSGAFEAVCRRGNDGTGTIYARYVGEQSHG